MAKTNHIDCDVCGTLTETKETDVKVPRFGKVFNFKVKDAEVCPNCSETYLSGKTTKNISRQLKKLVLTYRTETAPTKLS